MRRPTETVSVIGAMLNLALAFGVHLTGDQVAAINVAWLVVVIPGVTTVTVWLQRRRGNVQVWMQRDAGSQ